MKAINPKSILRITILVIFLFLISFSTAQPSLAFEQDTGGYIPADQTINDDLIISAETVIIDGIVNGDVITAAETVIINGTINGNLVMNVGSAEINGFINGSVAFAGQQLTINSTIDGSLYFAGVELSLNSEAQINRNIMFAGFSLESLPGSIVGTDIHGTGYQIILGGYVGRNVFVDVAATEVTGKIAGNAEFHVEAPDEKLPNMGWLQYWVYGWGGTMPDQRYPGLRIAPESEIRGQLTYKSSIEQSDTILIEPGDGIEFIEKVTTGPQGRTPAHLWLLARLRELLTLLALGALAIWMVPSAVIRSSHQLRDKPIHSFGWGILSLIIGYTAILVTIMLLLILGTLLAIVTLGGLAGAVFGIGFSGLIMVAGIFTIVVVYGSKIVFAYLFGDWIVSRFSPEGSNLYFVSLLVGIIVYMLFRLIPIVSVIFGIIATLFGLGAIALAFKNRKKVQLMAAFQTQAEAANVQ